MRLYALLANTRGVNDDHSHSSQTPLVSSLCVHVALHSVWRD